MPRLSMPVTYTGGRAMGNILVSSIHSTLVPACSGRSSSFSIHYSSFEASDQISPLLKKKLV